MDAVKAQGEGGWNNKDRPCWLVREGCDGKESRKVTRMMELREMTTWNGQVVDTTGATVGGGGAYASIA